MALAVILFLPIPFGNIVPALAIAILALAVLERDGVAAIAGTLVGLAGFAVVSGVIVGLVKGAIFVVQSVFFVRPAGQFPHASRLLYPEELRARSESKACLSI